MQWAGLTVFSTRDLSQEASRELRALSALSRCTEVRCGQDAANTGQASVPLRNLPDGLGLEEHLNRRSLAVPCAGLAHQEELTQGLTIIDL